MATALKTLFADATSYTTFAAWAKWLTDNIVSTLGWTQTSDFGQVNWTNLATSAVVPQSSSNSSWTSFVASANIGTGAGGVACSAGSGNLVLSIATTTGLVAGKSVLIAGLTGTAGITGLNGLMFTILSV